MVKGDTGRLKDLKVTNKDQREWVFEVREVKSENKKLSLFFDKCKVKKNAFTLFREVQSEIKMLSLFFEK